MKKKAFAIISALVLIVCLCSTLVACGEKSPDKDSNNLPADYDNYFLENYVDYSSVEFEEITADTATQAISDWVASEIETAVKISFDGSYSYHENDEDTSYKTHTLSCTMSAGDTLYVNAEIDDTTVVVESKNEHVYFSYQNDDVDKKYSIDVTEFVCDFFYNVYGLTEEDVMQKQNAYNESLEEEEGNSSETENTIVDSTMMMLVNSVVSYLMNNDALDILTASNGDYTHVKISANPDSFISSLSTWINAILSSLDISFDIQQAMDMIIKDLGKFDMYLTFYKYVVVGAHIDFDVSIPTSIAGIIGTMGTYVSSSSPLIPWLDTEPIALPSKVNEALEQLSGVSLNENAWVQISGSFDFVNLKAAIVGTLDDTNTTSTTFVELLGEPVPIEKSSDVE